MPVQETVVRNMETHPAVLYKFITSQAGSVGKAIMELVQNSIDAGATSVRITLTQDDFKVEDDGRGFGDADEIHDHFGTFGTPHVEGDSKFGRFRLGRGQIMAFARTKWHTPGYVMDVDVKERGLNYILTPAEPRRGVTIEGTFYERMDNESEYTRRYAREYEYTKREIKDLIKYSETPVFLNGDQISIDPRLEQWDIETPQAYFSLKGSGYVKVYNMGFAVTDFASYKYGSAVVVTKVHLALNMARNSILESSCPVWKAITKTLRENMVTKIKKEKLSDDNRSYLLSNLRYGHANVNDVAEMRLLTAVNGTTTTLGDFIKDARPVMAAPKGDALAQRIHTEGLAFVIAEETLARAGCETVSEFKRLLTDIYKRDKGEDAYELGTIRNKAEADPVKVAREFMGDNKLTPKTTLTPSQRVVLDILTYHNTDVQRFVGRATGRWINSRTLKSGESAHAAAWTDGLTYIAFTPKLLDNAKAGFAGWAMIAQVFAHEYLHDEADGEYTYCHSNEFYETLNNVLTHNMFKPKANLYAIANDMYKRYLKTMQGKRKVETEKQRAQAAQDALQEAVEQYVNDTEMPKEEEAA